MAAAAAASKQLSAAHSKALPGQGTSRAVLQQHEVLTHVFRTCPGERGGGKGFWNPEEHV